MIDRGESGLEGGGAEACSAVAAARAAARRAVASWTAADASGWDRCGLEIVGFLVTLALAWVATESFRPFGGIFVFAGLGWVNV